MENRVLIITNDATKSFAPDIIQVRFTYEDLRDTCLMAPMSCDCDGVPEIDYNPEERCLTESVTVTREIE